MSRKMMKLGRRNVTPRPKTSGGRMVVNPGLKHRTGRKTYKK
jgi:hypothetical protein